MSEIKAKGGINERFNAGNVQGQLVNAKRMRRLYDAFWDGEDGLKQGDEILGCEFDPDYLGNNEERGSDRGRGEGDGRSVSDLDGRGLRFEDFQAVVLDGKGQLEVISDDVRNSLTEVVLLIFKDKKAEWDGHGFDSVYLAGLIGADGFEREKDPKREKISDIERTLRTAKLNILKIGTLNAIMHGCGSFEECRVYFEEWRKIKGIERYFSDEFFAIWMEKTDKKEEKLEVLRVAIDFGVVYSGRIAEGFFKNVSDKFDFLKALHADDGLREVFFCEGWIERLVSMETDGRMAINVWMQACLDFRIKRTDVNVMIALFDNVSEEGIENIFIELAKARLLKTIVADRNFINKLLLRTESHVRRMAIVAGALGVEGVLDGHSIEILFSTNDYFELVSVFSIVAKYFEYQNIPVPRIFLDKLVKAAYFYSPEFAIEAIGVISYNEVEVPLDILDAYDFSVDDYRKIIETTSENCRLQGASDPVIAALHYAQTGEYVDGWNQEIFLNVMAEAIRGVALEEGDYERCMKAVSVKDSVTLIPLIAELIDKKMGPIEGMNKYLEKLNDSEKKKLRCELEECLKSEFDISIEEVWLLSSLGIEFEFNSEEGNGFSGWIDFYGAVREGTSELYQECREKLILCWREEIEPGDDLVENLRLVRKSSELKSIWDELQSLFEGEGFDMRNMESERWTEVIACLQKQIEKARERQIGSGKKGRGRKKRKRK